MTTEREARVTYKVLIVRLVTAKSSEKLSDDHCHKTTATVAAPLSHASLVRVTGESTVIHPNGGAIEPKDSALNSTTSSMSAAAVTGH